MGHGHGRAPKAPPVPKLPESPLAYKLLAAEPGSPEYYDVIRYFAAGVARHVRAACPHDASPEIRRRYNATAKKAARKFLESN